MRVARRGSVGDAADVMMKIASTIIVLLAASFGVGAMLWVSRGDGQPSLVEATSRRLLTLSQLPIDQVTRIAVKRGDDEAWVFQRTESAWKQVEPFEYPMDPFSIRQIASLARELEVVETIDPQAFGSAQDLASVSLHPPLAQVRYEWPGGTVTLELGRRSLANRAYLSVAGDPAIYVVGQQLHERAIEMDSREWRDRTVFRGVGPEAARIELQYGTSNKLVLARERKEWKMIEPVRTRVDPVGLDAFLQALGTARVGGFILDQPPDLSKFGLTVPAMTLTVVTSDQPASAPGAGASSMSQRLLVGGRVGAGSQDRFAMIEGRPVVVKLTEPVLRALIRQPQDLAAPTASGVQPADVKTIIIRHQGAELKLQRELERWRAPEHQDVTEVSSALVQELLDHLTALRASNIELREYPRDQEVGTMTLYGFDEKALDTIRIARDPQTNYWYMDNGDNVLRVYPAGLKLRMTPSDFGLP